ncbi:MAG: hypothetical protein PHD48_11845 [Alphaproteobacteria bacterium]|nr:hypothetical protein [Alphaproteobacteria bacterium]
MPDFHKYLMRHGEFGVQYFIELAERYNGIVANTNLPLEERWVAVMFQPTATERFAVQA